MIVNTTIKSILRFRRWSRKSYAMFLSMGKCVSIGCLKKNIIEVSLDKQQNETAYTSYTGQDDFDIFVEEESRYLPDLLTSLFLTIFPQYLSSDKLYCALGFAKQSNGYNCSNEPDKYNLYIYPAHLNFIYKNSQNHDRRD